MARNRGLYESYNNFSEKESGGIMKNVFTKIGIGFVLLVMLFFLVFSFNIVEHGILPKVTGQTIPFIDITSENKE